MILRNGLKNVANPVTLYQGQISNLQKHFMAYVQAYISRQKLEILECIV